MFGAHRRVAHELLWDRTCAQQFQTMHTESVM